MGAVFKLSNHTVRAEKQFDLMRPPHEVVMIRYDSDSDADGCICAASELRWMLTLCWLLRIPTKNND